MKRPSHPSVNSPATRRLRGSLAMNSMFPIILMFKLIHGASIVGYFCLCQRYSMSKLLPHLLPNFWPLARQLGCERVFVCLYLVDHECVRPLHGLHNEICPQSVFNSECNLLRSCHSPSIHLSLMDTPHLRYFLTPLLKRGSLRRCI